MSSSDLVPLKNSLKTLSDSTTLKQLLVTKIQNIVGFQSLKSDVELSLYICNCLENAVVDLNVGKIDKKALIISVFTELFSLSPDEQLILGNQVQFLFDHKKIKQIQKIKVISSAVLKWGLKKFA